jgi:hypothetical protein
MTLSTCIYGCSPQHRKRLVRKALLVNVKHARDSAQSLRWVIGDVKVSTRYGEVIAEPRRGTELEGNKRSSGAVRCRASECVFTLVALARPPGAPTQLPYCA